MAKAIIHAGSRRSSVLAGTVATIIGLSIASFVVYGPVAQTTASVRPIASANPGPVENAVLLASPGRIEGRSDLVEVGAALDGIIQSIAVKEGQRVAPGDVLAELDCRELQSALPVARAEAESFRQVRDRLLLGSRKEERQAAAQRTAAAKAVLAQASRQMERYRPLEETGVISTSAFDQARRDGNVAEADYQQALHTEELVNAGPLVEEVAKANADLAAAEKRITLGEEKLGKCVVRAPIAGTVLRIMLHPGESFALVAPRPVLTLADLSGRRVRAEVDEQDVGKVRLGQSVVVFSDAYAGQRFAGKVTKIASTMGRKSVLTGEPADKHDRDILEVLAQLEPAALALPIGLRATVQFHPR
jgi:HlyD family secretion protein